MLPSAFWLIALIVLLVGEAITIGLTFVWFAVGALGALIVSVLGGALWLQVVVFLALSGVTLALARPVFARFLKTSHAATNADRVIGQTAVVTEQIDIFSKQTVEKRRKMTRRILWTTLFLLPLV